MGFYDPASMAVCLPEGTYDGRSITAVAVACHECGHAMQQSAGSALFKVRARLRPLFEVCAFAWLVVTIAGIATGSPIVCLIGACIFGAALIYQAVMLVVEVDASARALDFLASRLGPGTASASSRAGAVGGESRPNGGVASGDGVVGARRVLQSCSLTYLTAVFIGAFGTLQRLAAYAFVGK